MTRLVYCVILASMCFAQVGCAEKEIEFISITYPEGESSLRVWENGQASLFYGALPQGETIKSGTFNTNRLYDQISPRLHPNVPREDRPDPEAEYGMVQIRFKGKEAESHLIYNEQEFTNSLFNRARSNVVGKRLQN